DSTSSCRRGGPLGPLWPAGWGGAAGGAAVADPGEPFSELMKPVPRDGKGARPLEQSAGGARTYSLFIAAPPPREGGRFVQKLDPRPIGPPTPVVTVIMGPAGGSPMPMTRTQFQELAEVRIAEAAALLAAGLWDGAYYLAGYAVE